MPRVPLDPNRIYRECDSRELFGFGPTALKEKIRSGDIPAPKLLAAPPSRARGWWGWQINEWADRVEKAQAEWAASAKDFYQPTPPSKLKPAPEVAKVKK